MGLAEIRKTLLKRATRLLTSEKAMQLLADPRVQKAMMGAINLQITTRERWRKGMGFVARRLDLATREDISGLKRTIRTLEGQVKRLQAERDKTA